MKKLSLLLFLLFSCAAYANPRGLEKYVPQKSFMVIGADFAQLRNNAIFQTMQQKGEIWSNNDDSDVGIFLRLLKIDPQKDVRSFIYSKYINSYGSSGKLHIFDLLRDISSELRNKSANQYLSTSLYRVDPEQDRYAVLLTPMTVAVGSLNEAKMAVDLAHGKLPNMSRNAELNAMFQSLPAEAGIWGLALPLSRRAAASVKAKQSTNALLEGFQHYYFYGIPTNNRANSHFYGEAGDEKQASLLSAFMIGTLTVAKFRVEDAIAEMLDQVNIEHSGKNIHVSAVVTKEMVDAYFKGKLGVE
jgi:hypothetical protein